MTDHPITPPRELVQEWLSEFYDSPTAPGESTLHVANRAAQWVADQELEACTAWLRRASYGHAPDLASNLRAARRPKPPSLKKQALMALEDGDTGPGASLTPTEVSIIRRALEALPDD